MASTVANADLVRRLFEEGMNQGKTEVFAEVLSPDYVNHSMPAPERGPAGFAQVVGAFTRAFSGFRVDVQSVLSDGDRISTRGTFGGVHTGAFNGIPGTGKTIRVNYIDEWRVQDGQLTDNWVQLDMFTLLQQIGVIPAMEAAR